MAFTTVLNSIPEKITAGDSVSWLVPLSDYPASGFWELTYTLVKSDTRIQITARADGSDHLVEISAAASSEYSAGEYAYQAHVSNGTERYLVDAGEIEILPDFSGQASGYDARSHVKKVLDALEAVLENRASKTQLAQTVGPVQVQHMSLEQIIAARDKYRAMYLREKVAAGDKIRRVIRPRFYR